MGKSACAKPLQRANHVDISSCVLYHMSTMASNCASNFTVCATFQANNQKTKALHYCPFERATASERRIPSERASNAERIPRSQYPHCICLGLHRRPWRILRDPMDGKYRAKLRRMDKGTTKLTCSVHTWVYELKTTRPSADLVMIFGIGHCV